jgi:hypothetical protein
VPCSTSRGDAHRVDDHPQLLADDGQAVADLGPDRLNLALSSFRPMGSAAKIRASISFGSARMMGSNPMWARTSWPPEYHWHGLQHLFGNGFVLGGMGPLVILVVLAWMAPQPRQRRKRSHR